MRCIYINAHTHIYNIYKENRSKCALELQLLVCPVSLQQFGNWAVICTVCSLQLRANTSYYSHTPPSCIACKVYWRVWTLALYFRSEMNYVYVVKFNISLTCLDMYTSSTEPPPPPGPSSTLGNELLCVVCRLIIHIGHHFMHYIFNSYTTGLGVLQDIKA